MKEIQLKWKTKLQEEKTGTVVLPETLGEFNNMLGEGAVLELLQAAYIARQKRRLKTGFLSRKRIVKIPIRSLSDEQRATLRRMGLLVE